jgi:phosphoglycerate dehydrogenase-like enzyme
MHGLSFVLSVRLSLQGIFNDDTFSKMKRGARVINVARGGVIDEPALVRALDAGIVAQARISPPSYALCTACILPCNLPFK